MTRAQRQLMLYQSPPHPCSYLDGRSSSSVFIDPEAELSPNSYGMLLELGFRRSGAHVYRPQCPDCQACISARVPVADFQPRRRQRRALQANADLQLRITPPRLDPEHYALYQAYTGKRHEDGEMAKAKIEEYQDFLIADWCQSEFMEFRLAGRLVALAVTDRVPGGLSAVYTFFDDPDVVLPLMGFQVLRYLARTFPAAMFLSMAANAAPLEFTIVYSNHVNGRLMPFQT